jgi:hypothetical protein
LLKNSRIERATRMNGPAPMRPPASNTSRNMAKFSEIRSTPSCREPATRFATMNSTIPFSAAGSRRMRSRESPCTPHGTSDSTARSWPSPSTASTSTQVPSAGSPSRPSAIEKPRSSLVSRHASACSETAAMSVGELGVTAHPAPVPGLLDPPHGLAHAAHGAPVQVELGRLEDGLVAQLQRVQSGPPVGDRPLLAGPEHAGRPGVPARLGQPRLDRGRPGLGVADRITTGQTGPEHHPVGDRRLAGGREDGRLVAAGREVAQRVAGTVRAEQQPQL